MTVCPLCLAAGCRPFLHARNNAANSDVWQSTVCVADIALMDLSIGIRAWSASLEEHEEFHTTACMKQA